MKKETTKSKKVKAIPDGYHTITPFLVVDNIDEFVEFLKKAFNAEEVSMARDKDQQIAHAALRIGNSMIMAGSTKGEMEQELAMLFLYVDDADAAYKTALAAGAESVQEPKDEFYGDRVAGLKDKWGNKWWVATHKEDVDGPELQRRMEEDQKKRRQEVPTH